MNNSKQSLYLDMKQFMFFFILPETLYERKTTNKELVLKKAILPASLALRNNTVSEVSSVYCSKMSLIKVEDCFAD